MRLSFLKTAILEDAENGLPLLARELLQDLSNKIQSLNLEILHYDRRVSALVREMASAKARTPEELKQELPSLDNFKWVTLFFSN